jgi:molybdopterin-containing oxidoreductase family iron-sulfur binding subunit
VEPAVLSSLADDLARAGDASLVLAGPSLPREAHAAVALLNSMLGAEGRTVETAFSVDEVPLATPVEMAELTRELRSGKYAAAIFHETNPSYGIPDADAFNAALAGVPLTVSLALFEDETTRRCDVVLPVNHWLESWNDFEPSTDLLGLQQPLIRPLYPTRQTEEILLGWAKKLPGSLQVQTDYRKYLRARWQREVYPEGTLASFEQYWVAAVHDGVLRLSAAPRPARQLDVRVVSDAAAKVAAAKRASAMELVIEPDVKIWDGRYAQIGWLQELPHPISKVCWGNYLAVSRADARRLGVSDGDMVSIGAGSRRVGLPVLVQPGQAAGTVFAALGYGREGKVAGGRGANVFPLVADDGSTPFFRAGVRVARLGGRQPLVRTQNEFGMHGRDIVRLWSLDEYRKNAAPPPDARKLPTLNKPQEFPEHKWGMAIDLSACTGCASCQIACQSENNVAVVGPEQVARGRTMHWLHSDVYYVGSAENPQVAHSLGLCQQCDDAPCESVCPVAATVHSDDGLNEQIYNRCIGVRYCAANCPYLSRRFNFFDYTSFIEEPLDLAFNPEVTVRPRGVMEKCTFCVQRIRNGVQVAKDEGRPVRDGEIRPACAVACPADAIVFGDLEDPDSRVSKLSRSNRGSRYLEELGIRPSITYLTEIRNPV